MENLTTISETQKIRAEETINGQKISYSYEQEAGQNPRSVVFSTAKEGRTIAGGYVAGGETFDLKMRKVDPSDLALLEDILTTCRGLCEGEEEPEPEEY